jgi:hypothetical protein
MYYKAHVYLTAKLEDSKGVKGTPCLETASYTEKEPVFNFVQALYKQGIIEAYRMLYSPDDDKNSWYMDKEVVYLPHHEPIMNLLFND